jgi:hypothetical protein
MIGKLLLAGAVGVPAVATATVAATGVAWVDVREGGQGGQHIVVPVPLLAAELAASFVPEKELAHEMGEALQHLPAAREVLKALAEGPDGELVRVEEEDQQVVIEKRGDTLRIQVHGRGGQEEVTVNLPLDGIADVIGEDGRVSPLRAVRLLRHARFSTLVEVKDGDDHVKVSVF